MLPLLLLLSVFSKATCWLKVKPLVKRVQNLTLSTIDEANPFSAEITGRSSDEDLCENEICSCEEAASIVCTCTEAVPEFNLSEGFYRSPDEDVTTVTTQSFLV